LNKKKLLFLTPQLPYPPNKGTAIRNFNLIKNLGEDYDISLLSFVDVKALNGELTQGLRVLGEMCSKVQTVPQAHRNPFVRLLKTVFTFSPDLSFRLYSDVFVEQLVKTLNTETFDAIQIEGLEMASLWAKAREKADLKKRPTLILDEHNAEYVLQRRAFEIERLVPGHWIRAFYSLLQWAKLKAYEGRICRQMDGIITVSEQDRQQLLKLNVNVPIAVVPNGVDVSHFREPSLDGTPLGENSMVFTGTMDFRPNIDGVSWFSRHVWPLIYKSLPDAKFYIVGRSPRPEVLALEQMPGIVVTGAVRDIRPFVTSAMLSIVPIRVGGGSRLKILEAMAAGTPIVSTSLGAEGIDVTSGLNIAIADKPEDFAAEVVDLITNQKRRETLATEARKLVEDHYDWPAVVPIMDKFYSSLINQQSDSQTPLVLSK
jgi:sugar transferase (PEP-CTERM/EpsH1 system associated)